MAHSIELLFDAATDAAIRRQWQALIDAHLPSQGRHRSPTNAPHVTVSVSDRIAPAIDADLRALVGRLPLPCRVGPPVVFGAELVTLVRLILPSAALLQFQERVAECAGPHQLPGPFPHGEPGQWVPHVTLCRRLPAADLPGALEAIGDATLSGEFAALRRWDGDARTVTGIGRSDPVSGHAVDQ